jgi:hypothetical protein
MTIADLIKQLRNFPDDWEVAASKRLHVHQPGFRGKKGQKYGYVWDDIILFTVRTGWPTPTPMQELSE